jgi:DNA-binding CsgD family transcriptional regulator
MIGGMARRLSSPVMVGRDAELHQLQAAAERGAAGETQVVVVGGEAGVGKSRLIEEFARDVDGPGRCVAIGGCPAVDTPLPYAPIVAAVDSLIRGMDDGRLAEAMWDIGPDLARIHPVLSGRLTDAVPVPVPEHLIAGRVFGAVSTLITRLGADRPLVVVFEDLHWADRASLDLIAYLMRNRGWPGAIVITYRTDELHRRHPLVPWLGEIARLPSVERIDLDRLGRADVEAQVVAITGRQPERRLVDDLVNRTGGNAFFVEELLASLRPDGTDPLAADLQQVLMARIDALPDAARPTVNAIAVAGSVMDTTVVASVLEISEPDVEAAIRIARDAQVLVDGVDDRGAIFRHALMQEAVYDALLPSERRRYHLGYARALQSPTSADPRAPLGRLAEVVHHALAADDLPTAYRVSIAAGEAAAFAGAFVEAARLLEQALRLFDAVPAAADKVDGGRAGLLRQAAEATRYAGDPARSVALWKEALAALAPDAPAETRATLLLGLAIDANETFDNELALASTLAADRLLTDAPPSRLRALAFADLGRDLFVLAREVEAAAASEQAVAMALDLGDRQIEAISRGRLALDRLHQGRVEEAFAEIEAALDIARVTRDRVVINSVYMNAGWLYEELGEAGRAADLLVEGIPISRELGLSTLALTAWAALYLWFAGRWSEGRQILDEAERDDRAHSGRSEGLLHTNALYDATMGRFERAAAAVALVPRDDPGPFVIEAELCTWRGDPDGAIAAATDGIELATQAIEVGERTWRGWLLRLIARAEADRSVGPGHRRADDRRREAAARAADAAIRCRELLAAGLRNDLHGGDFPACSATADAEATRATGTSDPAAWKGAVEAWDRIARPFEAAYARYRLAEALLSAGGRRSEAAEELGRAAAAAADLGAIPLAKEIEALATRSRIALDGRDRGSERSAGSGLSDTALTRREVEVLALLAEGRTNRQIADTLFISESTASVHVSNILGKLGVSGRTEAAAVALRGGLVPAMSNIERHEGKAGADHVDGVSRPFQPT